MPVNWKIFRTSTFRLSAIYLAFFALSVLAVLGYVYWNTARLIERQTDETIRAEVQALGDQYRLLGLEGVAQTVRRRSGQRTPGVYILAGNDRRIAGNLEEVPVGMDEQSGWIEFPIVVDVAGRSQDRTARAYYTKLSGDYQLVVGRDIGEIKQFGGIIRRTMISALLISLVLGLGGGFLMSRNFLRRVDAITGASRAIMAGNLSSRMPVSGTNDELDRLARSLNEMLDQIERLMAGLKDVSSNVAHDLKTPLTRMRARVESALRTGSVDDQQAALEYTIRESEQLLKTFDALLSIARTEAGEARELMQIFDVAEVVRDAVELYEPMAEEQGGTLTVEAVDGLYIRGDRQLLAQALSNLIDNALKYGVTDVEAKPAIAVTAASNDQQVILSVADRGVGIPESERMRVLERFVRLEESRSRPGNGLGLSLVAGIVKLHNGTLRMADNGPGLRVEISLPLQHRPA